MLALLLTILFIVVATAYFKWPAVLVLLIGVLGYGLAAGLGVATTLDTLKDGFGSLLGAIGLLIVLGAIIGVALERSGAALRIVEALLGDGSRPALRLAVLGAIVSVPVFCDSGFILLAGLLPAVARRTGRPVATLALALAGGLYLTHTLVPPTPGPLAAAAALGAEDYVGTIMLLGGIISVPVLFVVTWAANRLGAGILATVAPPPPPVADPPSVVLALLPLVVPVGLIALGTVGRLLAPSSGELVGWLDVTDPTLALLLGALLALWPLRRGGAGPAVGSALALAGPVLVITGLGGAFGKVVQASALADSLTEWAVGAELSLPGLLAVAFAVAALLKTAQGSSTGALVITAGIIAPLLPAAGVAGPVPLALVTLAIGGGAMTVSHANDSYFWVITRFSGISVGDGYRSFTVLSLVLGLSVLAVVLLLAGLLGE